MRSKLSHTLRIGGACKERAQKIPCNLSTTKFATKYNLDHHLKLKTTCDLYNIQNCTKLSMNAHIRSAHSVTVQKSLFNCQDVGTNFTRKLWLDTHIRKQSISRCDHCGTQFCNIRSQRLQIKNTYVNSKDS